MNLVDCLLSTYPPVVPSYTKMPHVSCETNGILVRCGQGESNSRLILGKDPLYHLTMAAFLFPTTLFW